MRIMIGMPCGTGSIPYQTVYWLHKLNKPAGVELAFYVSPNTHILAARNHIIQVALANNMNLLFIDDDNPPPVDILEKMLKHAETKDIITGLVPSRQKDGNGKHRLCIFDELNVAPDRIEYNQVMEMPEDVSEPFEVYNCGFGCIFIKHEVLKDVAMHYPMPCEMKYMRYYQIGDNLINEEVMREKRISLPEGTLWYGMYISEDLLFNDRAKRLGYKIRCDPSIQCTHIGDGELITIKDHILPNSPEFADGVS